MSSAQLVPQTEGVWLDLEREERADRTEQGFVEIVDRLAAMTGTVASLRKTRGTPMWDRRYDPPKLLGVVVRFDAPERLEARKQRRQRKR